MQPKPDTGLPAAAWATIVVAGLAGVGTLCVAIAALAGGASVTRDDTAALLVLTSLVIASWVWPLVMYRGASSEAVHLDEGFLVIMAVVLPAPSVVLGFASAIVVAQFVRRRPWFK